MHCVIQITSLAMQAPSIEISLYMSLYYEKHCALPIADYTSPWRYRQVDLELLRAHIESSSPPSEVLLHFLKRNRHSSVSHSPCLSHLPLQSLARHQHRPSPHTYHLFYLSVYRHTFTSAQASFIHYIMSTASSQSQNATGPSKGAASTPNKIPSR